jgi:hypothetical protein
VYYGALVLEVFMSDDPDDLMQPWVQVAAFVNIAMHEPAPGGWMSLIRIMDRFFVPGTTLEMPPTPLQTTLVIMLKSGNMRTTASLRIRPRSPAKKEMPAIEIPVLFEGDERGVNVILPVVMMVEEEGIYWFDVFIDEQLFTRIPIRVVYQRGGIQVQPGSPTP